MSDSMARTRELVRQHLAQEDPLGWFEALYKEVGQNASAIPWVALGPNRHMLSWVEGRVFNGRGKRALVVGCGLGDDAEFLAARDFQVTGFDIAPRAIAWCGERFPGSPVHYVVADLFAAPAEWTFAFDFVLETYTVQSLPQNLRRLSIGKIADFVAPGGDLLLVTRSREEQDPVGQMPWPLTRNDLSEFARQGLEELQFDDFQDAAVNNMRRFRVHYRRPAGS